MKGILKVPLIVAAVFIVLRIVSEQLGAGIVNNLISVVLLYMLVFPIYCAIRIANSGVPGPYRTHFKLTVLYAVFCRLMIVPTYWLAYILNWQNVPRFTLEGGGVVGGDLPRAIGTPFVLLVVWTIGATVVGGGLGSLIILIFRKKSGTETLR